jgi:hypothetical protein
MGLIDGFADSNPIHPELNITACQSERSEKFEYLYRKKNKENVFLRISFYTFVSENHLFSPFLNPVRPDKGSLF